MSFQESVSVLNYVGSKERMAGVLCQMIPKNCTVYAAMFCGSAAVALNSRKFDLKILNDFNPNIANFWRVATDPAFFQELLETLQKTEYSRSDFDKAKARREEHGSKRTDVVQWAVDTFILNRQSFNGAGECWVYRDESAYEKFLKNPLKLPLAFKSFKEQEFRVHNQNALDCMNQEHLLENPETFLFLDPPYLEGLRSNAKLYAVDMPDMRDHIDLLKAIQNAESKIVLSGYWSGLDDGNDLYDYYLIPSGWHRHLLGEYSKGCERSDERSKGAEWVWTNYDLIKEAPGAVPLLACYCADKRIRR
ncbi:MAG: DNA adenine methylase [Lacrimispora sphenoides]